MRIFSLRQFEMFGCEEASAFSVQPDLSAADAVKLFGAVQRAVALTAGAIFGGVYLRRCRQPNFALWRGTPFLKRQASEPLSPKGFSRF